jgi:hypothetical protein
MLRHSARVLISVAGAILAFAAWLVGVLSCMPRPPKPPSYPVTLTGAAVVAAGFALGLVAGERITHGRQSALPALLPWCLAGCAGGATLFFPFGGMMAGFGILGLGTVAILAWEIRLGRRHVRAGLHRPPQ